MRPLARGRGALLLGATLLVVTGPIGAWAASGFSDVPPDHPYHDDISWLADSGITRGCEPDEGGPRFCPADALTREQAAAMLHRFAESDVIVGEPGPAGPTGPPGASGGAGPRGPSNAYHADDTYAERSFFVQTSSTTLWSGTLPAGSYVFDTALLLFANGGTTTVVCSYWPAGVQAEPTSSVRVPGSAFGNGSWSQVVSLSAAGEVSLRCQAAAINVDVREVRITAIQVETAQPFPTPSRTPTDR